MRPDQAGGDGKAAMPGKRGRPDAERPPLIVTLTLETGAQRFFEAQRRRHFPPERLQVGAHVTLFHALPGVLEPQVAAALAQASAATPVLPLLVTGLRSLGRGVAYALASPEAAALRARLRTQFAAQLTPQDRAAWAPHVTVQNKVPPEIAHTTLVTLQASPHPNEVLAIGVALWRYRGGPWDAVAHYPFKAS